MTRAPDTFWRVALAALLAVLLQLSALSHVRLLGASPDVVPLVVAAVAFYGGSVAGAATGFGTGVLLDLALGGDLGVSSLVLTVVGYGVGRYREVQDPAHGLAPIAVGAGATAGYLIGLGAVSFMLEIGATVSLLVLRDTLVTVALNALIALPAFALARRGLRSVLVVDPVARRRRVRPAETGPIGLRGLGEV